MKTYPHNSVNNNQLNYKTHHISVNNIIKCYAYVKVNMTTCTML